MSVSPLLLRFVLLCLSPIAALAEPVDFDLPAQPAAAALRSFAEQAQVTVHFSAEELASVRSGAIAWRLEPVDALNLMLRGTGFVARQNDAGEFIVSSAFAAPPDDTLRLAPIVVETTAERSTPFDRGQPARPPRTATGNLDLRRSANDALPYTIYDRAQIVRSGVADLNDFLQRAMLDGDPAANPGGPTGRQSEFGIGSTNLNLRGYGTGETVVLVNGRRLPEVVTSGLEESPPPPDVNFIPLSLVEQIEVLPVSSAALYAGNAVGGVINIVLRPDAPGASTEVTTIYTNALAGFDAPQTTVSLLHGHALLGGALRVRLNASFTAATPATEAGLGYHRAHVIAPPPFDAPLYGATPNLRSADGTPLFGPGSATVTSVAPGADGSGGLAAFADRQGGRNARLFDGPGEFSSAPDSLDFAFGRQQKRATYFASATGDVTSWLQLGLEATHARTVLHRGYGVLRGDLALRRDSPFNPFRQDVRVSLDETAPLLGQNYSEGRIAFSSAVLGMLCKLPGDWRLALDTQYARNTTLFRGLAGADPERWQQLVDAGRYQPLRDTQIHGPPEEFYDRVLIYRGGRDQFVTLGSYETMDLALRATREALHLPTGAGGLNFGADYRRNELAPFRDEQRYGDGSPASAPVAWNGRALQRYSVFGELQAPLLPERWLPSGVRRTETDLAARYTAADSARETNFAPTFGLKIDFAGGFSIRGSVATANRFPTPSMSRRLLFTAPRIPGSVIDHAPVFDPVPDEHYTVDVIEGVNPNLRPEAAVTQTAGGLWQHGEVHQVRASLDFVDTRKTGELVFLDAQTVINLEPVFPERVKRAASAPGRAPTAARVISVVTGTANMAWRHSQNWNASFDYAWTECGGGRLELYSRLLCFSRFDQKVLAGTAIVDQLRAPDGAAPGLLRYRANFGAGWSRPDFGLGFDGHYFAPRALPSVEWRSQGDDQIDEHWQFDAFVHRDLSRWLPWRDSRFGLRGQLRVNNVLGTPFPRYVNAASGAGVQPYGDWRGRVYSLSLTATY